MRSIQEELNSLSNPVETVLAAPAIDQRALRKRIVELTPRFRVANRTRFKYLVARAVPSATMMDRLWRIFEHAPHYYPQVAAHLGKFKTLLPRHADRLLGAVETQELYPTVQAALIGAAVGRFPASRIRVAKTRWKRLWKPRVSPPDLSEALWRWLIEENSFTPAQLRYGVQHLRPSWLHMKVQFGVRWQVLSTAQRESWLNYNLRSSSADVAIAAAWLCGLHDVSIQRPIRLIHPLAKLVLKEQGLIRRADSSVCGIQLAFNEMTGENFRINWRKFFGRSYKRAEAQIVTCKGCFKTNPSAWVNSLDVFVDLLLEALYRLNPTLGNYVIGTPGSVMNSKRLRAKFPGIFALLNQVHAKRLESDLSHAVVKKTKKPTAPVRYRWLRTGARLLRRAAQELRAAGY